MSLNQAKRLILMRNRSTPKQDTNFSKSNTFHHFWFLIDVYVGDYIAWKLNAYNQFWTTCLSKKKKKKNSGQPPTKRQLPDNSYISQ